MSLWMVRGGRFGQDEQLALDKGLSVIGFYEVPDLTAANTRAEIEAIVRESYPDANDGKVRNFTGQLHAFKNRMESGDLVVLPLKGRPQVALGRIAGPYVFRADVSQGNHTRKVQWLRRDVPRTHFGQDLLYSLGAFMTICQIHRNNAEERVRKILEGERDPGLGVAADQGAMVDPATGEGESEESSARDIEQLAKDQILSELEVRFKRHDLARLVEAVLRAQGYVTRLSPPGPDGGVDVLAGRGPLGLDPPRICAQVKSSQSAADVNVLRALQGTMTTFKADQGLLVSWVGFTASARKEARQHHFSVRLWEASELLEAVVQNYDALPEEIRSELPLKRIWALVLEG